MKTIIVVFCFVMFFGLHAQTNNKLDPTGNVGVGTLSPMANLQVKGSGTIGGYWKPSDSYFTIEDGNNQFLIMDPNEIYASNTLHIGAKGSTIVKFRSIFDNSSPVDRLVIENNGFVGIGTNSPASRLTVSNGASGGNHHTFSDFTIEDDENGMISILTPNQSVGYYGFADTDDDYVAGMHYEHSNDALVFRTNNHSKADLRIGNNGNVSIAAGSMEAKTSLIVDSNFGANVSGSSGGNAVFGSNLGVVNGGANHMKLVTPSSHTNHYGYSGMQSTWGKLYFYTKRGNTTSGEVIQEEPRMMIDHYGKVGIGTTSPDSKLAVNGNIRAKEVKVEATNWPDYVFQEGYDLPTLQEIQTHIQEKGHLPNIPSSQEVESNGLELGEMNRLLLEKIEELTLYTLMQQETLEKQHKELDRLKKLELRMVKLEKSIYE